MASAEQLKFELLAVDRASRPIQQVQNRVKDFDRQVKSSSVQMNSFGGAFTGVTKDLRKFSLGGLQQAGYQIGDYAVQVANGTSKMQAFGQQAGQFFQIFGPFGAVLGAAISVMSAFFVAKERAAKATESFADSLTILKDETAAASEEIKRLSAGISGLARTQVYAQLLETQAKITKNLSEQNRLEDARPSGFRRTLKILRDELDILTDQEGEFEQILDSHEQTISFLEQEKGYYDDITGSAEGLAQTEQALNQIYEARLGTIDDTANNYVDIIGSEQGLAQAMAATNQIYAARLKARQSEIQAARDAFIVEASVTVAETERAQTIKDMQEAYANLTSRQDEANTKTKETAKIIKSELSPELMRIKDASEMIGSSFENAFMSVKDGTMSVKDAFNSMANDIINELYRMFVVKQITGFISSAFTGAFSPNLAGTGGGGGKAIGGPVQAKQSYIVGERGPEMFIPSRSGSIVPNNKLGGGTVVVNQNINVATGVQQTVRAEVLGLMPQIAEASKAAVLDARRRGGSFAGSF
jgi:gas vesicle protein